MAHNLGLGPSLYLIQLQFFIYLFMMLTLLGTVPLMLSMPSLTLSVGGMVDKSAIYQQFEYDKITNLDFKCKLKEDPSRISLITSIRRMTVIDTGDGNKNKTLNLKNDQIKALNNTCFNKIECGINKNKLV